jgi:hypothetical protein
MIQHHPKSAIWSRSSRSLAKQATSTYDTSTTFEQFRNTVYPLHQNEDAILLLCSLFYAACYPLGLTAAFGRPLQKSR